MISLALSVNSNEFISITFVEITLPKRNGGFTIRTMPAKTRNTLTMSTTLMVSLMKIRAKNTVNIGEDAEIITVSANGKCYKNIENLHFYS